MKIAILAALAAVLAGATNHCSANGGGATTANPNPTPRSTARPHPCHAGASDPTFLAIGKVGRWELRHGTMLRRSNSISAGTTFHDIGIQRYPDQSDDLRTWNKVELRVSGTRSRCVTGYIDADNSAHEICSIHPVKRLLTGRARPTGKPYHDLPIEGAGHRVGRVPSRRPIRQTADVACAATKWLQVRWGATTTAHYVFVSRKS